MSCSDFPQLIDFLYNLSGPHIFDAIYCFYAGPLGPIPGIVFNLFVYGTVFLMYYISGGSVVVPLVLSIITAGLLGTTLPAGGVNALVVVFMFGVPTAGMWLIHRARSSP